MDRNVFGYDYDWQNESLTVTIGSHDVVEIPGILRSEIEYRMIEIQDDFDEFIARKFSDWLTEGKH
jgi:hypothetical protein